MNYSAEAGVSGWAWLAMAVGVLLLAALSFGAFLLLFRGGSPPVRHTAAQRRLDEQFARGQVSEQEYLHLSAELDESGTGERGRLRSPRKSRDRLPKSR